MVIMQRIVIMVLTMHVWDKVDIKQVEVHVLLVRLAPMEKQVPLAAVVQEVALLVKDAEWAVAVAGMVPLVPPVPPRAHFVQEVDRPLYQVILVVMVLIAQVLTKVLAIHLRF